MKTDLYKFSTRVYYDGKYMDTINEMWTYERVQKELTRLREMAEKLFLSYTVAIINGAYHVNVYF